MWAYVWLHERMSMRRVGVQDLHIQTLSEQYINNDNKTTNINLLFMAYIKY